MPPWSALAVAGALSVLAAGLLALRARPWMCFAAALGVVACAGAARFGLRMPEVSSPELTALLSGGPRLMQVRGVVRNGPQAQRLAPRRPGDPPRVMSRLDLDLRALKSAGWSPLRGRLRVYIDGAALGLAPGDEVETWLSASAPGRPSNPGEFDFPRQLRRQGISGAARVDSADGFHVTGRRGGWSGARWIFALRTRCLRALDGALPPEPAAVLQCLVLGERSGMAPAQENAFRRSGTLHYLAVSGLHVGLVAAFVWGAATLLGAGRRATAAVVLAATLAYALLAGCGPSAQRAAIMCAAVCGAYFFRRRPDLTASVALALTAILLADPGALFSPGLQLSFVAAGGILLLSGPLERAVFPPPDPLEKLAAPELRSWTANPLRWTIQKAFCVSLSAWLATLPLMAQHFDVVTLFAAPASLTLLPAVWLAMLAGLPGTLLASLSPVAAAPLLWPAAGGAWAMEAIARCMARLPGASLNLPPPGWGVMLAAYAFLIGTWAALRAGRRLRAGALALAPAALYLGVAWHAPVPAHTRLHMLSVGRGHCTLVRFADGRNLLFDAGSAAPETAERVAPAALWALGVRRLDLLVVSHGDSDHSSGVAELARKIPIGRVVVSRYFDLDGGTSEIMAELAQLGVPVERVREGDVLSGMGAARLEVLWPPDPSAATVKLSENELSMVLAVRDPEGTILLTGDFGHGAAGLALRRGADWRADVLQVPHHGLSDPSASLLAETVRPRIALIPGGRRADAAPYARWAERVLETDAEGMLTVELGPELRVDGYGGGRW